MLFRKMLRDMKLNKAQFISIFLMTILGVFIYSGLSSEWYGASRIADDYYKETNLADAWVYSSGFTKEAAKKVADIDGVTGVERRLTLESNAALNGNPTVTLHFVEDNKLSTFQVVKGEEFSLEKDGLWLDNEFAKAKGLKVGDQIKISMSGYSLKKEIKGLVISPEYVYPAADGEIIPVHENHGYAFLSCKAFPKEIPITYTELMITKEDTSHFDLEDEVDKALDGKYSVFLLKSNLRSYMQFHEEMKEHKAISKIFPVAFLAVAMLTIATTMARLVYNQRTHIGILKAVGFKRRRILFHYISYGLWISMFGTVIGAVLGYILMPAMLYSIMKMMFTLPGWYPRMPLSVIIMAVLSVICCTLVTYFTCRNVLKDTAAQSLRPKAPKSVKHSFLDRWKRWNYLSFYSQWNARDILRCKGRSFMAIVGIAGCSALLICAFSMRDTLNFVVEWDYGKQNIYESRMELEENITKEQADHLISKYGGQKIRESSVEVKANGKKQSGGLLVTDHTTLIQFVDAECNHIKLPEDQISISYKMAENLGVKAGDSISWHIYGEEGWKTSKIGAIYRTPTTQGITMSKEVYEEYDYSFIPSSLLFDHDLSEQINKNKEDGIAKVQTKAYLIESYNSMTETMDFMIIVLIMAAALLAAVVIYNLGVLSFTERHRDLSTLKVIGFKTKKLRTLLQMQNLWLSIIGIIIGIPIGLWMVRYIFQFVGNVFDFIIIASFSSFLYSVVGTMIISIFVNRFFSRRIKAIDMVSSLKGVE